MAIEYKRSNDAGIKSSTIGQPKENSGSDYGEAKLPNH
jgi:hypothetical protein